MKARAFGLTQANRHACRAKIAVKYILWRPTCPRRQALVNSRRPPKLPIAPVRRLIAGVRAQHTIVAQRHDIVAQITLTRCSRQGRIFTGRRSECRQQSGEVRGCGRRRTLRRLLHATEHTPPHTYSSETPLTQEPRDSLFGSDVATTPLRNAPGAKLPSRTLR